MKIAVLGTGTMGLFYLRLIRCLDGVNPIAVPSRQSRLAELQSDAFMTAPDVRAAAAHGATAAIIATDTSRHVEDGLSALECGLDLLVEKPLSSDARRATALCRKAAEVGRRVFVGCVLRFSESLITFRNLLGSIGRLHSVRIECQAYLPDWRPNRSYKNSYSARAEEGGVLRDLIHEIDYAGWIYDWPAALQARVRNLGRLGIAAEEVAHLTWEAADGCVVSVSVDYLSRPFRRQMRAFGEHGTLEWDGFANTVILTLGAEGAQHVKCTQTRDEMLLAQTRAFINATRGIYDPRLATGEDGVKALAVCDAARRSAESRREEEVDYP